MHTRKLSLRWTDQPEEEERTAGLREPVDGWCEFAPRSSNSPAHTAAEQKTTMSATHERIAAFPAEGVLTGPAAERFQHSTDGDLQLFAISMPILQGDYGSAYSSAATSYAPTHSIDLLITIENPSTYCGFPPLL